MVSSLKLEVKPNNYVLVTNLETQEQEVAGLRLKYRSSVEYLSPKQRLAVIKWIGQKTQITL